MKNKIVTLDFLTTKGACVEGLAWFENKYGKEEVGLKQLIADLQAEDKLEWINWLLTRLFTQKKCVMYAVYAAELVLPIFEKKFPEDMWPRNAIEAAKAYIANPCEETKQNAKAAVYIAAADTCVVYAPDDAASDAASDVYAYAPVYAAPSDVYAYAPVYAIDDAFYAAADSANYANYTIHAINYADCANSAIKNAAFTANAAGAAANEAMHKITDYGIKLLEEEE